MRINLETAVVKAINTIADALYDFDNNGCCYRKNLLKATEKFNESYRSIHSEYIKFSEESSFKQKELPGDEVDVDEIRCEVDDLMEYYWEKEVKIPHNDNGSSMKNSFFQHNSKEKIDMAIDALKKETEFYLQHYCLIKLYVAGRIDRKQFEGNDSGYCMFKKYEELRNDLMGFKLSDHPFAPVLLKIEKTVWSIFESHPDGIFSEGDKIKEIISTNIDNFRNETDMIRYMAKEEFDNIENRKFDDDVLCGVKSNIDKISSDNEDVAKNILSMILKLEADKDDAIG